MMTHEFTKQLLQLLKHNKNQQDSGFTLIELLVVILILATLAAIALPNFLGQAGKARETEGKNAIGTINRSQQAYHFEKQVFTPALTNTDLQGINALGVTIKSKYFDLAITVGTATETTSVASSNDGNDGDKDGVKNYSGGIGFNAVNSQYNSVLCYNNIVGMPSIAVTPAISPVCPANTTVLQ